MSRFCFVFLSPIQPLQVIWYKIEFAIVHKGSYPNVRFFLFIVRINLFKIILRTSRNIIFRFWIGSNHPFEVPQNNLIRTLRNQIIRLECNFPSPTWCIYNERRYLIFYLLYGFKLKKSANVGWFHFNIFLSIDDKGHLPFWRLVQCLADSFLKLCKVAYWCFSSWSCPWWSPLSRTLVNKETSVFKPNAFLFHNFFITTRENVFH